MASWHQLEDQEVLARWVGTKKFNVVRLRVGDGIGCSDLYGVTLFGVMLLVNG